MSERDFNRLYCRRYYLKNRGVKCVICRREISGGGTRCPECAKAQNAKIREKRAQAAQEGRCGQCGHALSAEEIGVYRTCARCRAYRNEWFRKLRAEERM